MTDLTSSSAVEINDAPVNTPDDSFTAVQPAPAHAPFTHKWLIALAVMLGTTLEVLDTSIINVALPHMQGTFSASVDEIAWVLTSYLVANGVMIPMTGWISSRFGRKRYFLFSMGLFVAASALCGAAHSLSQMVSFRLLQGAAGAAMIPSSQAILMESFPPKKQGIAQALFGLGVVVAPVVGPVLGGWLTDSYSWRWIFYINIPIGLVAIWAIQQTVEDPPWVRNSDPGPFDGLGLIALSLWARLPGGGTRQRAGR